VGEKPKTKTQAQAEKVKTKTSGTGTQRREGLCLLVGIGPSRKTANGGKKGDIGRGDLKNKPKSREWRKGQWESKGREVERRKRLTKKPASSRGKEKETEGHRYQKQNRTASHNSG